MKFHFQCKNILLLLSCLSIFCAWSEPSKPVNSDESDTVCKIMQRLYHIDCHTAVFNDHFDITSLKLISPSKSSELANILKNKKITVRATLKNQSKLVAIEFEPTNIASSTIDIIKHEINCNNISGFNNNHSMPTRHQISSLMSGKDHFLKYYEHSSMKFSYTNGQSDVIAYVSDYLNNSLDLTNWSQQSLPKLEFKVFEQKLQKMFAGIYSALMQINKQGFAYTDIRPGNILIDSNENAYLNNLNAVILVNKPQHICVASKEYYPPDVKFKTLRSMNDLQRVSSWTFCLSIYQLVCPEFKSNPQTTFNWFRQEKPFLDYFKCNNAQKASEDLTSLLSKCLVKNKNKNSFLELANAKWLKNINK